MLARAFFFHSRYSEMIRALFPPPNYRPEAGHGCIAGPMTGPRQCPAAPKTWVERTIIMTPRGKLNSRGKTDHCPPSPKSPADNWVRQAKTCLLSWGVSRCGARGRRPESFEREYLSIQIRRFFRQFLQFRASFFGLDRSVSF